MARPLRIEYPDACYHVINRGIDRRSIYDTDQDYEVFLGRLVEYSELFRVDVRA